MARPDLLALDDVAGALGVLDEVVHEPVDAARAGVAEDGDLLRRQVGERQHARPHGIVDVVVDVGDAVDQADDLALERRGLARPARVAQDPVAHRLGEVEPLEHVDDPQRVLVVAEAAAEALARAAVEHVLADVAERRVAEVVAEPDRLHEVLVEPAAPAPTVREICVVSSVWVSRVR